MLAQERSMVMSNSTDNPAPVEGAVAMVERVALALGEAHAKRSTFPFSEHSLREFARAAIEAMREPTEAMEVAGYDVGPDRAPVDYWRAMIVVALNGGPPKP